MMTLNKRLIWHIAHLKNISGLTMNKLQQRYDFTSTKVKITNYKTKFVISLLRKGMTICL